MFFSKNVQICQFTPKSRGVIFEKSGLFDRYLYKSGRAFLKVVPSPGNAFRAHRAKLQSFLSVFWAKQWATSCTLDPKWTRRARLKKWKFSKCDIWSFNVVFGHFGVFYQTGHQIWPLGVHFWRLKGDWSFKKTTCRSHFWTVYSVHRWARSLITVHP